MQTESRTQRVTAGKVRRGLAGIALSALMVALGASAAQAQSSGTNAGGLTAIRVVAQNGNTSAIPFDVALKNGYFKDAGLDVTIVTIGGGGGPVSAALKTGQVDVSLEGAAQGMQDIARGVAPGKIIGELTDNTYVILGGDGITDIKQLKGKIFGISGYNGGDQLYSEAVLAHYGISQDDVTWLPVGIPSVRLAALEQGRIQGTQEAMEAMPESAKKRILFGGDNSPIPTVSLSVFVRQPFLDSSKPALQKFLAAIGKGADTARAHPDQAQAACLDNGANASDCKIAIDFATTTTNPYTWSSTARLHVDAVKAMIPFVIAGIPQAKTVTPDDFIDTTVAGSGP